MVDSQIHEVFLLAERAGNTRPSTNDCDQAKDFNTAPIWSAPQSNPTNQAAWPISSANGTTFSLTFALVSTKSTTFCSRATASNSDKRRSSW